MVLTFDPNNLRHDVAVAISNDTVVEPDQDFTSVLQLEASETGVLVQPNVATIVIVDDDSKKLRSLLVTKMKVIQLSMQK